MPICAKATAAARRTVIPRLSNALAMVAPPVHDLDGAFQTMVVREARTSLATFSRTVPSPPKQRTNIRPPSPATAAQRRRELGTRARPPSGTGVCAPHPGAICEGKRGAAQNPALSDHGGLADGRPGRLPLDGGGRRA